MIQSKSSSPDKLIEKLQIMVADSELTMIDDWRFENRAASRSAAIRSLIYLGLELSKANPDKANELLEQPLPKNYSTAVQIGPTKPPCASAHITLKRRNPMDSNNTAESKLKTVKAACDKAPAGAKKDAAFKHYSAAEKRIKQKMTKNA